MENNLPLMTTNAEYFRRVSGLEVFEPHGS